MSIYIDDISVAGEPEGKKPNKKCTGIELEKKISFSKTK